MATRTKPYTRAQARAFLNSIGLDRYSLADATGVFQGAYALGTALVVDEDFGLATSRAADKVKAANGNISAHFHWSEFVCGCRGRYSDCKRWFTVRSFLLALERVRTKGYPNGLHLVSLYRCARFNKAIGGYSRSLHQAKEGYAADIPAKFKPSKFPRVAGINDIGYKARHGLVTHVGHKIGRTATVIFRED